MKAILGVLKSYFEEEVASMSDEQVAIELLHFGKGLIIDLVNPKRSLVQLKIRIFSMLSDKDLIEMFPSAFAPKAISDNEPLQRQTRKP